MKPKELKRAHEGVFDEWCNMIFSLEKEFPERSRMRHALYLLRIDIAKITSMNREHKDCPQAWVYVQDNPEPTKEEKLTSEEM